MAEPLHVTPLDDEPGDEAGRLAYATPAHLRVGEDLGRQGRVLVAPLRGALPALCVKTGTDQDLVLVQLQGAAVSYHVRRAYVTRRRGWLIAAAVMLAAGAGVFAWSLSLPNKSEWWTTVMSLGLALMLTTPVLATTGGKIVWVRKRDWARFELHLMGVSDAYMTAVGLERRP